MNKIAKQEVINIQYLLLNTTVHQALIIKILSWLLEKITGNDKELF